MADRKQKQLNIIVIIVLFIALLFTAIFVFVISPDVDLKIVSSDMQSMNEGWILNAVSDEEDSIIDLPQNINASAGESVVISHIIPDGIESNSVILLKTEFQNVSVNVNNERVYASGLLTDNSLLKSTAPCYNIIDIGSARSGDIVTIYIASGYAKYSGKIGGILIGTRGDAVNYIIHHNILSLIIGIVLVVISIILGIILFFVRKIVKSKVEAMYAFLMVLTAALWKVTGNPVLQLATGNVYGLYVTSMVMMLLIPIFYFMYQFSVQTVKNVRKIIEILVYICAVNFLVGMVFQFTQVCDFATFSRVTYVLCCTMLVGHLLLLKLANELKFGSLNVIASTILTVTFVIEGILNLFSFYSRASGIILHIGLVIYLTITIVMTEKNILRDISKKKKDTQVVTGRIKEQAFEQVNTKLVYGALAMTADKLKDKSPQDSKLIYDISVYLNNSIKAVSYRGIVPFKQELIFIRAFLGIYKNKYPALDIVIEDKVINFKVPFNTIEQIVENAVINGALKANEKARIAIRSYERLDCFAIQIVDNGGGEGPDKLFVGVQTYKHVKRVLKQKCGASIEIRNKENKGNIVTVMVPKSGFLIKEE